MGRAHDTLDALQGLLDDDIGVHDLLVTATGEVYLGTDSGRRPSAISLEATSVQALVALLAEHADEDSGTRPAFAAHVGAGAWTVVRAPLTRDVTVLGRRCPRRRLPLGDFVDRDLMSSDVARRLVETVRDGRNLLVASPDHGVALRVLDALVPLGSPGQLSFYIGDARSFESAGTSVSVIDRAALDDLPDSSRRAVLDLVRGARWVFLERLSTTRDLEWWFGGDAFGRGRISAIGAGSTRAALAQLQALHASLHHGRTATALPASELVDSVLFVEHLRPGRGQTFTLEDLDTRPAPLDDAAAAQRPPSTTAIAAIVSSPEPADATATPAASRVERPASTPAPAAAAEIPAAAVHRRGRSSQSNPRIERPAADDALEHSRTGAMPRVDKPDTAAMDSALGDDSAQPAAAASSVGFDDFSDFGDLFSDDSAAIAAGGGADAPAAAASTGGGDNELFGPGELDDVLGVEPEPDTSSPAPRRSSSSPRHPANPHATTGSRYNADTTRNDADSIRASRYRPDSSASSRTNPNEPRRPRSGEALRNVRRATPSPIPAVSSNPAQPRGAASNPAAASPSGTDWRSRGGAVPQSASGAGPARPLVGRGAATRRRVSRPETNSEVLSSGDIEYIEEGAAKPEHSHGLPRPGVQRPGYNAANNAFMQEGTLDDDVVGDFASEPTRRAEWPKDGG